MVRLSFHFLQFAVSSLGVRLSVVGLCSSISIFFGYYLEYCLSCGEGFFSFFFVTFVSDVCLSIYYTCFLLCLLLVCWVRENFSGGPGHIFPMWDSAVWSAGPVQFYLSASLEWMAGLYRFSLSGSVVVGAVRLKWWGGGLAFFSFLYFAVGSPGVRLPVVGFSSFIN